MQFTKEQREIIDRLLKESDDLQKKPGSRYYTLEEFKKLNTELKNRTIQSNFKRAGYSQ